MVIGLIYGVLDIYVAIDDDKMNAVQTQVRQVVKVNCRKLIVAPPRQGVLGAGKGSSPRADQ
jgi:hypothetical protein